MSKYFVAAICLFAGFVCRAQIVLNGKIIDGSTGEELIGASVVEKGSTFGTITSVDGTFALQLAEGEHVLEASYIGYMSLALTVNVSNGSYTVRLTDDAISQSAKPSVNPSQTNPSHVSPSHTAGFSLENGVLTIWLVEDSNFLDGSVVTGRKNLEGLQALQNERRASAFALENLGSKEMSVKGLSDAKESVAKISGISFADAGQLIVRGLGDRYSTTTLNGLPIASPNPDNKLIPLDIFPSTTIQAVTVCKVYEASSFADYSGAHIDISTKSGGSDYMAFSLGTGGMFGTLFSESWNMVTPSLLSSYRLDSQAENLPYSDFAAYAASKNIFARTPFTVKRRTALPDLNMTAGLGKVFRFRGQELSLTANLSSKYSEHILRAAYLNTYEASGMRKSDFRYIDYQQKEDIASLVNIEQTLRESDRLALTAFFARNASRSFAAKNGTDYEDRDLFGESQTDHRYMLTDVQLTGSHLLGRWDLEWGASLASTLSDEPDRRQMLFQKGYDGRLHFFTNNLETYRYFGKLLENEYTVDVKLAYHFDDDSRLRFGATAKDKTRAFRTTRFLYDVSGIFQAFDGNMAMDIEHLIGYEAYSVNDGLMQRKQNKRDRYDAMNMIGAAFVEYDRTFAGRLSLNAGVRFEASRCRVDYNDDVEDTSRILDAYDPFFALNLKYRITDEEFLRLSASRTITRASFVEMAPFLYQESYGGVMLRGNASLRNAFNYNFDLKWEHIGVDSDELFAVTAYFKWLKNPIERIQRYSGGAPEHSFQNAENGLAAGVEAEFRKDIFKYMTVSANASYMYTNVKLPEGGVYTNSERGLQGASPYLVNADLTYAPEYGDGRRVSLALLYNLQGPRIHSVGLSGLGDVKQMPFHSLDFNAVWSFTERWSLNLSLRNILCSKTLLRQDIPMTGETVDIEGWNEGAGFSLGISWKL